MGFRFPKKDTRCTREVIGFNDTWFLILGIPIIGFWAPILFFQDSPVKDGWAYYSMVWFFSTIYTASYWLAVRSIMIWKRRRFPRQEETMKRIVASLLTIIPFFFAFNYIMDIIQVWAGAPGHAKIPHWQYVVTSAFIIILVSALYESVYLYNRWKESLVEQEKLKREFLQSELEGLKNQVNPHFLFNSLNTLIYLIPESPERAVEFVQKLAKVYRYVLEIQDKKLIALSEELNFLNAFTHLLKERFGAGFEVHVQVDEQAYGLQTVPLSLQILVENALKHNVVSVEKPLNIFIEEKNGNLEIRNNLQLREPVGGSTKLGLLNIRNRFAFFSERQVDIRQTAEEFCVTLPLLPQTMETSA